MHRRDFLLTSVSAAAALWAHDASASLAIAMTLSELVADSSQIWVGTPEEKHCEWLETRGGRHIVTYTRLRCETIITAHAAETSDLWVRTIGGHVGNIGQLVHGEPELKLGERNVVFMRRVESVYRVTGRAQGQFSIREPKSGKFVLSPSRNLADLVNAQESAAKRLGGLELRQAMREIRAVKP